VTNGTIRPATGPGKVFGIGMPKTGTSTLNAALEILGIRATHFPHDPVTVAELERGEYALSILEEYDAGTDVPFPAIFAQLDARWPGSRFIFTERDVDAWLASCEHASFNSQARIPPRDSPRYLYRAMLYGCISFDRERFRWVYEDHRRRVLEHFSGEKAGQLLVMDITRGDGWEKLCPFLGVPVPEQPFPNVNPHPRGVVELEPARRRGIAAGLRRRLRTMIGR